MGPLLSRNRGFKKGLEITIKWFSDSKNFLYIVQIILFNWIMQFKENYLHTI